MAFEHRSARATTHQLQRESICERSVLGFLPYFPKEKQNLDLPIAVSTTGILSMQLRISPNDLAISAWSMPLLF